MPMMVARTLEQRRRPAWTPAAGIEEDYNGTLIFARLDLEHFLEFCAKLRLDNGRPFELEDWQLEVLADYFDGVFETLLLLPSGNGKTTLYAAIALHHLLYTEDPKGFIIAASRGQGEILSDHIAGFVDRSKGLQQKVEVKSRLIELRHRRGTIRVLAAEADTADGVGGTLTICDEVHRWDSRKGRAMYTVVVKGCKKRGGQILHCSTAGETMQSLLGEIRQRCLELPNLTRVGMMTSGRAQDDSLAYHEFALAPSDDAHDLETVKQANPLSSITVESLRREKNTMTWWEWARFACGLWVVGQHTAISPIDWAACQHDEVVFEPDRSYILSADLAWVGDCTAITEVQAVSTLDVRLRKVAIITPTGDGTALREEQILSPVRERIRENPNCAGIVIDPEMGGRSLIEKFEDMGLTVIQHSQKNVAMCDAFKSLERAIGQRFDEEDPDSPRVLQVQNDPEMTRHVLAAEAKDIPGIGSKLVKRRRNPEPIDCGVSAAMGVRSALADLDHEPVDRSLYRMEFT